MKPLPITVSETYCIFRVLFIWMHVTVYMVRQSSGIICSHIPACQRLQAHKGRIALIKACVLGLRPSVRQ